MLQDFAGVTASENIPHGINVVKYTTGDILSSNIRPYLKKVWIADRNGGCSTDVLVIKSNEGISKGFLYYSLTNENFISYVMSGAKGVKMPRGDKDQMMKFSLFIPEASEQEKISSFLKLLDERISIQNKIIEDLKKLKVGICRKCFSKHPHNNSPLQSYFDYGKAGGTPTSTNKDYYDGDIPFLSINDITKQGKYIKSTDKTISDLGLKSSTAWVVPPYSLILSMYASVGLPAINTLPLATSQAMFSMVLSNNSNLDYLYYFLLYFKERVVYKYLETGTQSNINADIVKSIIVPDYGEDNIRIGQLLSSIDARLQDAVTQGTLYHKQKEVLLRKLFI